MSSFASSTIKSKNGSSVEQLFGNPLVTVGTNIKSF